jgi:hypothetical protein
MFRLARTRRTHYNRRMFTRPVIDVRRALDALLGWERTAALTGNARHEAVAVTCRQIAVERVRRALATRRTAAERALLRAIEHDAMTQTLIASSRAAIAESLALLDATRDPSEPTEEAEDATRPLALAWAPALAAE